MARLEVERELQIGEPAIGEAELLLAASERGAEPVQHLGGAGLRAVDDLRQLAAAIDARRSPG